MWSSNANNYLVLYSKFRASKRKKWCTSPMKGMLWYFAYENVKSKQNLNKICREMAKRSGVKRKKVLIWMATELKATRGDERRGERGVCMQFTNAWGLKLKALCPLFRFESGTIPFSLFKCPSYSPSPLTKSHFSANLQSPVTLSLSLFLSSSHTHTDTRKTVSRHIQGLRFSFSLDSYLYNCKI